jgi:hypothetical protein
LSTTARVRVQLPLQICLGCRSKSKNCDELINYTVRVIVICNFKISKGISIIIVQRLALDLIQLRLILMEDSHHGMGQYCESKVLVLYLEKERLLF